MNYEVNSPTVKDNCREEALRVSSGKAKLNGFMQWMPCIK